MNAKCTLQAYQINRTAKHFITGVCHGNYSMLGGIVLITTSLKSLFCELLDWPSSVLHYSKPRVPGEVIAIVFLFISFICELTLGIKMYAEWPGSKFATLNCTAFGERVGGIEEFCQLNFKIKQNIESQCQIMCLGLEKVRSAMQSGQS